MFLYLTHTMKLLFNCYFSILLDKLNCLSLCRLIAFAVIFAVNRRDIKKCQASVELQAFFIGVLVVLCLLIINECMIVCISMRGSVMNTRPRRHLPRFIYMQLFLYIPELAFSILGTYWAFTDSAKCEVGVALTVKITVIFQWLILLGVFVAALILFDPLGSKSHTDGEEDDGAVLSKQAMKEVSNQCCHNAASCHCFHSAVSCYCFRNAAIIASTVMSCCCFHSAISYHFCHSA